MFENVIGREQVTGDLRRAMCGGSLPRSILLSGSRYDGKSTIALEIARALTCSETGKWGCNCRSCRLHRTLSHPDTVLTGPRYFDLEIASAMQAFRTNPRTGTLFLLIRSVRKLVRRFDPFLWNEVRLRKVQPAVEEVEAVLQELEGAVDDIASAPKTRIVKWTASLDKAVIRLFKAAPREIVPIDLVRALAAWAHVSSSGEAKVVVMEEAHTLQEGARNSMLKLLEEPPSGVYFILTTSRRSAIIPTVLSRLRTYHLPERPLQEQALVQERIFRIPPAEDRPLAAFFHAMGGGEDDVRRELADRVVNTVLDGGDLGDLLDSVQVDLSQDSTGSREDLFFNELTEAVRRRIRRARENDIDRMQRWGALIRAYRSRIETRNMNAVGTVSALILTMSRDSHPAEEC